MWFWSVKSEYNASLRWKQQDILAPVQHEARKNLNWVNLSADRRWVAIMTWYGDEQIEALQDVHLLEPAGVDEGVNLPLTATVQQLQTILCAH